jgi:uncharacterized membrane protein
MKRDANLSPMDRAVRVFLGVALLGAGLIVVQGLPGAALDVVGAMLIFSGSVGFCHIYKVCGISTVKKP